MNFNPGFNIAPVTSPMGFKYGQDVFGPEVESRHIDQIRKSLMEPDCKGPEVVYSIAMDVGKNVHRQMLVDRHLLFGVVTYAAGRLGKEPVRSQGHIHKVSPLSGWSTPEVYEIWQGKAVIYMQETAADNPGLCFAVTAGPGDVVIVPPYWAHATISADPDNPLTFGAWCDRAFGFEYDDVRAHKGLAWFPLLNDRNQLDWKANAHYLPSELIIKQPNDYGQFGIKKGEAIYSTFEQNPDTFSFVPHPQLKKDLWNNFIP